MVVGRSGEIGKNFPKEKATDRCFWQVTLFPFPCNFPCEEIGFLIESHRNIRTFRAAAW